MKRKVRLAYLVTHPIQYQTPLLRQISAQPDIDLTVFFCSDLSVRGYTDPGFGKIVKWDVPLLEGYRYEFLPALGGTDGVSFWRPFNYGLSKRLKTGRFDVLWIHGYARWFHWMAMLAARLQGIKVLIRDEATLISVQRGPIKRFIKRVFFLVLRYVCDGFLAIGSLNREYYLQNSIPAERIFMVPYAVDNAFFGSRAADAAVTREEFRASLGLESGRPVILYASKISHRKRPEDLLEAYVRLSADGSEPHPYLIFVGDGEMRKALEARVRELGWDSVKFLGFQNQTYLPRYYDLCDVFVLPSVNEPWGLVVNEAMNAGRAVIVSDQVGCGPDLVRNSYNGFVFKAGDAGDLHRVLRKTLDDPEECRVMGERSRVIINRWGFEEDLSGLKRALAAIRA